MQAAGLQMYCLKVKKLSLQRQMKVEEPQRFW